MTVYFSQLEVTNYRSCQSTTLQLTPFTALVGLNNCGKSNCLTALQWLVRRAKLGVGDFNDPDQEVQVIGELNDIDDHDLETLSQANRNKISPHVRDGMLRIRRTQAVPGGDSSLTVFDPDLGDWVPNPTGIDNAVTALFPDPIRIGAMENAEEDASKAKTSTTIGKLLSSMLTAIQERHEDDLAPHLGAILGKLSAEGGERFDELGRIDESINHKISDLFPGIHIKLDFPVPAFNDLIKSGTVKVYEGEGAGRSFGFYGHGAQRAIQMAMVRHLADLKRGEAVAGGATLLLVDEPELFMHPFAVEQVREALRSLSSAGYQVIFSTHSAQMVLARDAENALLMTKRPGEGTKARPRLQHVVKQLVEDGTHQLHHIFSLTNSAQVLFADRVVLAEGRTESRLLPEIFRALAGKTLGQASIAVVALGGVSNTKKSMDILEALGLPAVAIVDLDFAFNHAAEYGLIERGDPDIAACKAVLARLGEEGRITLNPQSQLPTSKRAVVSASEAYAIMAADAEAIPHVAGLVRKLKQQRVWLWSRGAIEAHLGITAKDESAWMDLQVRMARDGIDVACADAEGVRSLVQWLIEAEVAGDNVYDDLV
ncbi:AAA family ATPase [Luteimonas sp. RD2P54]|uniref:AAA family ATPase n=1 Tax=Luteimonas endophytica TaxID=3042023 RepID=A0ABT6JC69_9GAMM|nr:AAA family ATPase [Luteimonas endophytica]MDH5824212.1 AAA family ATPase [Luteimonas endophytica]